jgi:type IV fimbrial biogenesis protein FimT
MSSRSPAAAHRCRGFTAIEALTVCALLATLTLFAVPAFDTFMLNARRTTHVNGMIRALHQSRSNAILRALPVVLCKSSTGQQCTPRALNWSAGYIVFVNADRDSPPQVDLGEPVLHVEPRVEHLTISANRDALTYWPVSVAGTTASIVFCDKRGPAEARAIIVSYTGRPRVSQRDASGRPLRCT